jgi:hypothetical protein
MIKIFGADHELELKDKVDLNEVLEVMNELDEVYKKNSQKNSNMISIDKDILFYTFEYAIKANYENITIIIVSIIKYWDKFSKDQQDFVLKNINKLVEKKIIDDDNIKNWLLNQQIQ